jgi:hypothetical protein
MFVIGGFVIFHHSLEQGLQALSIGEYDVA